MIEFEPAGKRINQKEKNFLNEMGLKWCACCRSVKNIENFYKSNSSCKNCQNLKSDQWLKTNRNRRNASRQTWRNSRRELEKLTDKRYREKNKEKLLEKDRSRYSQNKELIRARKLNLYHKNKDIINQRRREKRKEQMKDPLFATAKRLRDRIRGVFKRNGFSKTSTTKNILGCDWLTAKNHLENQFSDGMSWENMGMWHIDHIKPLCSASCEKELFDLCHYTNLQPLWAKENLSKGGKQII